MVVKVYISGISGNKEVKKRQQRVLLILDSKNIKYEVIDIAEPNAEEAKDFMQNNSTMMGGTIGDPNPRHPLPPQIFNDDIYCGDYDAFDMANEIDEMEKFLRVDPSESSTITSNDEIKLGNGISESGDTREDKENIQPDEDLNKADETESKENEVPLEEAVENPDLKSDDIEEGENATDDQKAENGNRHVSDEPEETATEKSEEA